MVPSPKPMLNKLHSYVVAAELILLGTLALTRNVGILFRLLEPIYSVFGRQGLTPLIASDRAQDCYQVFSVFLFELALYNVVMVKNIDFVMSTLVARGVLVFLITPEMIIFGPGPADVWLYVLFEGLQVFSLYVSTMNAIERGVKAFKPDPTFSSTPARFAGILVFGLGASLVLRQAWYLIHPLDYLVKALGLDTMASLFLHKEVVPMAALCAQPVAQLGFLYFWNDQNGKFLQASIFGRVFLSGIGLALMTFLNEGIPDGLYLLSLWNIQGAAYTFFYLRRRVPYKRA